MWKSLVVEENGLKGQKTIAQGIALGKMAVKHRPARAKEIVGGDASV